MPRRAGKFVVFEGGEGAGKTTQLAILAGRLRAAQVPYVVTREPGGTDLGRHIRTILLHTIPGQAMPAKAEALLFAADRAVHVEQVVRPALARGEVVLCDRYVDSSVSYQGAGRGLGQTAVAALSEWATDDLLPDLVVLLDIDPAEGLRRAGWRAAAADRIERMPAGYHARVRDAFRARADAAPGRYLVLDATAAVRQLAADIADRVEDLLGQCLPAPTEEP